MAEAIVNELPHDLKGNHTVTEIVLKPGGKGRYEIFVDGRQVYSKLATGKHINDRDAVALIKQAVT